MPGEEAGRGNEELQIQGAGLRVGKGEGSMGLGPGAMVMGRRISSRWRAPQPGEELVDCPV